MNRRDFFRSAAAAIALPLLGRKAEPSEAAPQYQWEVSDSPALNISPGAITINGDGINEQELARLVMQMLEDVLA